LAAEGHLKMQADLECSPLNSYHLRATRRNR
jgi:hypothetical protein